MKALKSYHSFHCLKISERIEYSLLSGSHLVTKSSQPPNLRICITSSPLNLLAALALHLSSLARPPIILVTYNLSFLSICLTLFLESTPYASTLSPSLSISDLPYPAPTTFLPLLAHYSHHPLLCRCFTPVSKPTVPTSFTIISYHKLSSGLRTESMDVMTGPFLLSNSVFVFSLFHYFLWPPCVADADII